MSIRRSWSVLLSHPAVRYLDVKCRRTEFLPGWNELCHKGDRLRVQGVGTPIRDDTERTRVSGSTPSGFPKRTCAAMLSGTREHHTLDDSISYPDILSGSLTTVSKPCYSPRSAALQWCVRTPCPDIFYSLHFGSAYGKGLQSFGSTCFWAFHCFSMDSKELSSISDCFGDKKAIKTPKINTIWLELIARVLNMLIGLKGDNYYSKVFKRVNHKLFK